MKNLGGWWLLWELDKKWVQKTVVVEKKLHVQYTNKSNYNKNPRDKSLYYLK